MTQKESNHTPQVPPPAPQGSTVAVAAWRAEREALLRQLLKRAQRQLSNALRRVEIGTSAPAGTATAETTVATTERILLAEQKPVLAVAEAILTMLAATYYFQGFETDTFDWTGVASVASGTNGVTSAAGDFHGEAASGAFTRFGGYESTFPSGGYTTGVDVYLDVDGGFPNDTRFDWTSAINTPAGVHRRDFAFNAGFYNDSDATELGPRFVISASNNTGRANSFPKNPGRAPFSITQTGWYTFEHRFYNAGGDVLAVELQISDANGLSMSTWTLSDPSDIIGTTVGGHRYGWFPTIEMGFLLAIDNVSLLSINEAGTVNACKNDGWQGLTRADGSTFKNQGDCIQYVNTGK